MTRRITTITADGPRPKPAVTVDGRPVARRPRIGLGLTLIKEEPAPAPDPGLREAMQTLLDATHAGVHDHPLNAAHFDACRDCRDRRDALRPAEVPAGKGPRSGAGRVTRLSSSRRSGGELMPNGSSEALVPVGPESQGRHMSAETHAGQQGRAQLRARVLASLGPNALVWVARMHEAEQLTLLAQRIERQLSTARSGRHRRVLQELLASAEARRTVILDEAQSRMDRARTGPARGPFGEKVGAGVRVARKEAGS